MRPVYIFYLNRICDMIRCGPRELALQDKPIGDFGSGKRYLD
jgi:hypothetical protein